MGLSIAYCTQSSEASIKLVSFCGLSPVSKPSSFQSSPVVMASRSRKVTRRLRSSTFFTSAFPFEVSKYFSTGVSRPALKSPRWMAAPTITEVTVLLMDCIVCKSVP